MDIAGKRTTAAMRQRLADAKVEIETKIKAIGTEPVKRKQHNSSKGFLEPGLGDRSEVGGIPLARPRAAGRGAPYFAERMK